MLKNKFQFISQLLVENPATILHFYIYLEACYITFVGKNQTDGGIEFIATYHSDKNNWETNILELKNYIHFNYSKSTKFTFILNVQNFIISKKYQTELEEDNALKNELSLFNIIQKKETIFKENYAEDLIIASIVEANWIAFIKKNYINATILSDVQLHINTFCKIPFLNRIECCFFYTDCILKFYKNNTLQFVQKIAQKDVYQIAYIIHQATIMYALDFETTQFLYCGYFEEELKLIPILKSYYANFSMLNSADLQTLQVNFENDILPYYLTPYLYI